MYKIEYNCDGKNNYLEIKYRNATNQHTLIQYPGCPKIEICVTKQNDEIVGVRLNEFYTDNEKKGILAEKKFQEFLQNNGIPSLYIGQYVPGISFSQILKDANAHRPDFLIYHPELGNILVDVKCRKAFSRGETLHFGVNKQELEGLIVTQDTVKLPVWIAFTKSEESQSEISEPIFYIISVKRIQKHIENHTAYISYNENTDIYNVSSSIMFKLEGSFEFK